MRPGYKSKKIHGFSIFSNMILKDFHLTLVVHAARRSVRGYPMIMMMVSGVCVWSKFFGRTNQQIMKICNSADFAVWAGQIAWDVCWCLTLRLASRDISPSFSLKTHHNTKYYHYITSDLMTDIECKVNIKISKLFYCCCWIFLYFV